MGTKNPKISAYVPQEVFDCFQVFQEERGLSASKAATAIFCDYFGIGQTASSPPSGVTLSQFQALEERLARLEEKIKSQPMYQDAALVAVESQAIESHTGSPQLSLETETIREYDENPPLPLSYPDGSLQQTTSELPFEPMALTAKELANRFGLKAAQSITNAKNRFKTTQEFTEWSTAKDPEGIAWSYRQLEDRCFQYFQIKSSDDR